MGLWMVAGGFLLVMGTVVQYFLTIDKEVVPEDVRLYVALFAGGSVFALIGAFLAPSAVTITLALLTAVTGIFFIWLLGQRRLPDGELIVAVGDPFPELVAPNQDGEWVDSSALRGQRILFKFFRGSW